MPRNPLFIGLNQAELKELTDFIRWSRINKKIRLCKRLQAIYFSNEGQTVPEIAQELGCSEWSVYQWLSDFRTEGIQGLKEPLRIMKLTQQQIDELLKVSGWSAIGDKKRQKEYRMRWSFRQMAQWIYDKWKIKLSEERIRQLARKKPQD